MPETVTQPVSRSSMDGRARLELVLGQLDELPTLSPVATRLLTLSSDEEVELDALVALIEADPALTGKILGLCRRAGLALTEQITTVKHAAVMLGLEAVRSAVLSVAVYEAMETQGDAADDRAMAAAMRLGSDSLALAEFDRTGFWRYSIGVATACELLAASRKDLGVRPQEAFVAGLLAEIGKLMLDFAVPKGYARVLGYAAQQNISASAAANKLLGLDHHQAGAHVGERWGLPEALLEVLRADGTKDRASNLMNVVSAGVGLCRSQHIGFSGDPVSERTTEEIARAIGASEQAIGQICHRLHEAVGERCSVMGLDEQSTHEMLLQSIARANRSLGGLNETLARRTRGGYEAARALSAIEWFGRAATGADRDQLARAIAVSGSRVMGGERWAVAFKHEDGWSACELDAEGTATERFGDLAVSAQEAIEAIGCKGLRSITKTERMVVLFDGIDRPGENKSHAALIGAWKLALSALLAEGELDDAGTRSEVVPAPQMEPAPRASQSDLLAGAMAKVQMIARSLRDQSPSIKALAGQEEHAGLVATVVNAAAALAALHRGVAATSADREPKPATHSLREMVDSAVLIATDAAGWQGEVDAEGVDPSYYLLVDRGKIEGSVTELLLNAFAASSSGDVLIAAQRAGSKGRWEIRVTDRGEGLEPGGHERLFEPFVTGPKGVRNAGLGLTRARQWMRSHGGGAALERTEDGRTRATLTFTELGSPAGKRSEAA